MSALKKVIYKSILIYNQIRDANALKLYGGELA